MNAPLTSIPMDPADLDLLPPADIDDCTTCGGDGLVFDLLTQDPLSGIYDDVECRRCNGTGSLAGAA